MSNCLEEVHLDFDRGEALALWHGAMQCGTHRCVEKCADKTAADSADGVVGGLVGRTGEHGPAGLNTDEFELHQLLDRRWWKPVVHDRLYELPPRHPRRGGPRWGPMTPPGPPPPLRSPSFPPAAPRRD